MNRSPWARAALTVLALVFFVIFMALGTWQVKRRAWKLDLIARVEQRVHAPAIPAPGPAAWPTVTATTDEYRHVTATGTFLDASQTLVQAVTDLGAGYWVLTPLQAADGTIVLVNRGFVSADDRTHVQPGAIQPVARESGQSSASALASPSTLAQASAPSSAPASAPPVQSEGPTNPISEVTGLLRMTEPGGAFLRHNDPAANQWYSRDVQAIAAARSLTRVAPYFIDAEAAPPTPKASSQVVGTAPSTAARATSAPPQIPDQPVTSLVAPTPGLTVIHFHNSHLVYAITWYTLALMTAIAIPLGMRKQ